MSKKEGADKSEKGSRTWLWVILAVFFVSLILISAVILFTFSSFSPKNVFGNVALINIDGVITAGDGSGSFSDGGVVSSDVVGFIEEAEKNPGVKGILFEINSPGGSAYASKEIADAMKNAKKFKLCLIKEVGASGAYWIASSCDTIVAGEMSVVGSIGVIGSYLEFSGLLQKYNITYQRLVSTKYKDSGSPYKPLEMDERAMFQKQIDKIHDYFVHEISVNRKIPLENVTALATGEVFLGMDAKDVGLVDILGDSKTAEQILKQKLKIESVEYLEYAKKRSVFDLFSLKFSEQAFALGRGIGREMFDASIENQDFAVRT